MPVTQEELAKRLKAAREACGLKQGEAAEHLSVSRPTVAQMEAGNRGVTSLELDQLAGLYGRDIRDFLADEFRPEDALLALFRGDGDAPESVAALHDLRHCAALGREITNIEGLLGIDRTASLPDYGLPAPRTRWKAITHGERVAQKERRRLGIGDGPLPNVAELLEVQGVRTAQAKLSQDISGVTVVDREFGAFVVVNIDHPFVRRRFSYTHEYCHVLLDRSAKATVSRAQDRDKVVEVRANAFAAAFLMPADGVLEFVTGLGKGRPSRLRAEVFDVFDFEPLHAEGRPEPGSQSMQMYDVVLLASHFSVSRIAVLYRLKNLKLVNQPEFDVLHTQEQSGAGKDIAQFLQLDEPDEIATRTEFVGRFLALGFEALRRGVISPSKLRENASMVQVASESVDAIVQQFEAEDADGGATALVPE